MPTFTFGSSSVKVVKLTPGQTVLVSILILLAGVAVTYFFGIPMAKNALESKNWPSAEGVIAVSDFVTDRSGDSVTYKAAIAYDYTVGGTQYTGKNITFGDYSSSDPGRARSIVNKYPAGQSVKVYYDPDNPQTSVLEAGAGWSSFMVAGIGALFALAGLLGAVSGFRKMSGGSAPPIADASGDVPPMVR